MSGPAPIYVIELWGPLDWGECVMCEQEDRLNHSVGWYCGPTHDEIGSVSTEYRSCNDEPAIVGGMRVCKPCHDEFYSQPPAIREEQQ